ncbi:MAG TPA: phage major capsid protein [Gammaproteobacteria bacterium]|nr:phage major capsid protein [Gammaproteobacteria bacterium]
MPVTQSELQYAGKSALDWYLKNKPIDQIGTDRPLIKLLMAGKKSFPGAKQYVVEQLRKSYDSNFQWFYGDGQVSYNKKRTLEQAQYPWRGCHDGFSLNEDELFANGITITEGKGGQATGAEKMQLTNLLQENIESLRLGFEEKLDYELHLDGSQSGDSIAGLDHLLSTTPTSGTVGGIDRATYPYWRNNVETGVSTATQGDLVDKMEVEWRRCTRNGGKPDKIIVGEAFLDAFRKDAKGDLSRYIVPGGNASLDPAVAELHFHGVPMIWDPVFEDLDVNLNPAIDWEKRCYFINSKHIKLRPAKGHDMVTRTPPRVYDRYTYYWGLTWKGAVTMNRSNAHAVLSIA